MSVHASVRWFRPIAARWLAVLLISSLLLGGLQTALAETTAPSPDLLSVYESELLGQPMATLPLLDRLSRLESMVLGSVQSGSPNERQARLVKVLGPREIAMPATASTDSIPSSPASASLKPEPTLAPLKGDPVLPPLMKTLPSAANATAAAPNRDATDYPAVSQMERQLFTRDFAREDIRNRLARLEKKVFRTASPQMALVDRVDRLSARLNGEASPQQAGLTPPSVLDGLPANSDLLRQQMSSGQTPAWDPYSRLDQLEKNVFGAPTGSGALVTERLDALERRLYGQTFSQESVDRRLSRLDSRFRINQPTMANRRGNAQTGRGQNVQVGAGFSSNSTMQFSQDLIDMLPPQMRGQIQAGQVSTSGSSAMRSGVPLTGAGRVQLPSTAVGNGVTIEQTTETFGFPAGSSVFGTTTQYGTYGYGPGLGFGTNAYTPYGTRMTTTPYGGYGGYNGGLGYPNYQQLDWLERQTFGYSNAGVGYAQRMAALQRAQQAQSLGQIMGNGTAGKIGRIAGSMLLGVPMTAPANVFPMGVPGQQPMVMPYPQTRYGW
jgi:hypothetical protein